MCSGLQCDAALRYPRKCLLHCFRCRRHFLFQKDFACFIQNAVERPAIAEVQTNRELVSFENHVSIYPNSASLFHSRSPFLCALSASNTGSVSHPAETGLLIPSDKPGVMARSGPGITSPYPVAQSPRRQKRPNVGPCRTPVAR